MWGFSQVELPTQKREDKKEVSLQEESKLKEDIVATFNIDKLAYAVAMAETHNCTKWYWKMYNNCFWIKNWNTAPCEKIWKNRMCIYNSPKESYEAFKIIWGKWYKTFPSRTLASRWTWADRVDTWLQHVTHYYYN